MGLQIESGIGNGFQAGVNSQFRLMTSGVNASIEHHVNHHDGMAYSIVFNQSPTLADDCIFYMKNTGDSDIALEGMDFGFINATAVDAEVYFKLNADGTRNAATDVVPANLNSGSGIVATGDFEQGADLDGGAATLTGGVEIQRYVFANIQDLKTEHFNFPQDIIIKPNGTFTIWASDAGATYYFNLFMNYHSEDLA